LNKNINHLRLAAAVVILSAPVVFGLLISCGDDKPNTPTFVITATAGSNGSISPSGQVSVTQGADQTFTVTPNSGYRVADVQVDAASIGAVTSHTFSGVSANHTINADFSLAQPTMLVVDSGLYYHGSMGSSTLSPGLVIRAEDGSGFRYADRWIRLSDIEGDGLLSADSLKTDAEGAIYPGYTFNGDFGSALLRTMIKSVDTVDLILRASTLIWGTKAQGQYVKVGDTYATVKGLNGTPASVDVDPNEWFTYANYESAKGVVLRIIDVDQDSEADDWEMVDLVIVNTVYTGTFANGIGIGSTMDTGAVDTVFGAPDTVFLDPSPPAAWVYIYKNRGVTFFADEGTPKRVFEIHLIDPGIIQPAPRKFTPAGSVRRYR
jgi:hypothetical protein